MMLQTQAGQVDLNIKYHEGQEEIFFNVKAKKKVIAKGRRFGLTRGAANFFVEKMSDGIGPNLWVDTIHGNIDRYVERYFYPSLMQIPHKYWKWRQQKKELMIFGQVLDMRSADKPENIEGFGYKNIFLNEAGIILRNEYLFYNAIQPMMLDFDPEVIIGGTPKGKGLFHQLFERGQDPLKPNWWSKRYTSFENPFLTQKELHELVDEIPKTVQQQEIYAEFLDDSSTVFRNLRACATVRNPMPPKKGETYFAGIDLAKVRDFTVINILDSSGQQVYMDRFNQLDWEFQEDRIYAALKKYNNAYALIDSTGVGDPIYEKLRKKGLRIEGYKFTNESKSALIHSLMLSFDHKSIKIFDNVTPGGKVQFGELCIFEYEISKTGLTRFNAPAGSHDDCVIGLSLADWKRKNRGPVPRIW